MDELERWLATKAVDAQSKTMAARLKHVCRNHFYVTLADLTSVTEDLFATFPNVGPATLATAKEWLAKDGLSFRGNGDAG